ncbi:hypothetical protein OB947_03225 [Aeromonas bestiarum]|uniref:hypothetical protein n=1 Tax=Aeromonas TaxID=642 RepID=UPI00259D4620|nr:hypothetical protein [Aeromonas bestiarum]MDM5087924.1 hypothetical protein [Aeromonas bestiarum]
MKNTNKINILNAHFPMIGLSAEWIFQTWLISGTKAKGVVIFENEDNSTYELIEFHYEDEKRLEKMLSSGSLTDILKNITI